MQPDSKHNLSPISAFFCPCLLSVQMKVLMRDIPHKRLSSALRRDMIFYSRCWFLQKGAKSLFRGCPPVAGRRYTLQASPLHRGYKKGACIEMHLCRVRKELALIPHTRQCDKAFFLFLRDQRCILQQMRARQERKSR